MENYLIQLNLERDYDEMVKLLLNKEGIQHVKLYFTEINTKVLLSAFLIRNFNEYFLLCDNEDLIKF